MSTTREPREKLIVDLLTDKWTASNTFSHTPSIIYASQDDPDNPHITVPQPDSGVLGGGVTGFDGISGTGGSPNQTYGEAIDLHAFANDQAVRDSGASTDSAAVYLTGTSSSGGSVTGGVLQEVRRIIDNNEIRPSNPKTTNQPVETLAVTGWAPGPTDDADEHHLVITVEMVHWTA